MSTQNKEGRPKVKWETAAILVHDETKLAVRIQKLPINRPKYSFEIGWVDGGGTFKRFLMPPMKIVHGKVEITPINTEAITWVTEQAEIYIFEATQKREDEIMEQRRERELRHANHGKPEFRSTGKTARKKGHTVEQQPSV